MVFCLPLHIWNFSFLHLFFIRVFFYFCVFFEHCFFRLFYGATQMDPDRLGSCASHYDSLISLSYSMAVFSTKSFGLFFQLTVILLRYCCCGFDQHTYRFMYMVVPHSTYHSKLAHQWPWPFLHMYVPTL